MNICKEEHQTLVKELGDAEVERCIRYVDECAQATGNSTRVDNVLGIIFDRDFTGYTRINEFMDNTGLNKKGRYSNLFWGWTFRYTEA